MGLEPDKLQDQINFPTEAHPWPFLSLLLFPILFLIEKELHFVLPEVYAHTVEIW